MKLDIKKFKQFTEQTGLGYGAFCVFQLVLSKDKLGIKYLHSESSSLLKALEMEGWIEYYEDVKDGNPQPRYRLTDRGTILAEIFLEDLGLADIHEILAYFDEIKKRFNIPGVINPLDSNIKMVKKWYPKYSIEQFKKVIDYFVPAWQYATMPDGTPLKKFLNPKTLFNGKFDLRVEEAEQSTPVATSVRPKYKPL